jgi:hypothetical protein
MNVCHSLPLCFFNYITSSRAQENFCFHLSSCLSILTLADLHSCCQFQCIHTLTKELSVSFTLNTCWFLSFTVHNTYYYFQLTLSSLRALLRDRG